MILDHASDGVIYFSMGSSLTKFWFTRLQKRRSSRSVFWVEATCSVEVGDKRFASTARQCASEQMVSSGWYFG